MKITYLGHASFLVQTETTSIVFDPFISPNPAAAHIEVQRIPADYILLSHGHGDHLADVIAIAQNTGAMLISNYEITEWFAAQGVAKTHPMNFGGKKEFGDITVRYVQALHSSTLPDGSSGGHPGGFIVTAGGKHFYYSGDTALMTDMQLFPRYGKLDFAILCIGDNFTMGYEDALTASDFIQCNTIIGMHFDTFPYIKIDHETAQNAFAKAGKSLRLPTIGETFEV